MKIIAMTIYGYGKFENVTFSPITEYQVFYGENEAGKSTIMSFIHSVLFGFPTKQQSDLRYEPKKGAKYGGQLIVMFPEKGRVVIERVKGKATGDVSVHLDSGIIGGEELLKELLSSIDKNVYQSIFSFNLHGLQNVHSMKGEELGRFLFSTGAIGSDRLLKVENELSKELDARFKPNGKNPVLNVKQKELRHVWSELKKAEENNEQYINLLRRKEVLEEGLRNKKESISRFTKLEHLKDLIDTIERSISKLTKKIESLEGELQASQPNFELLEREGEINRTVESLSLLQQWQQEFLQLQVQQNKIEDEIRHLQNRIHIPLSHGEILSANTSIFMKERVLELQATQKRLKEKKRELDDQFQETKRRLEEFEKSVSSIEKELLPDADFLKLKERLSQSQSRENLLSRKKDIRERVTFLTKSLNQFEKNRKRDKWQFGILLFLFMIIGFWGWFSDLSMMLMVSGIGVMFSLYSLWKLKSKTAHEESLKEELEAWQLKEVKLEDDLNKPLPHLEMMKEQIQRDENLRAQLQQFMMKLENQKEAYENVIDRFEIWEQDSVQLKTKLLAAGKELKVPDDIALNYIADAFEIIHDIKLNLQEKKHLQEKCQTVEEAIKKGMEPLIQLTSLFFQEEAVTPKEGISLLKRRLRDEIEKSITYQGKQEQLASAKNQLQEQVIEANVIKEEISEIDLSVNDSTALEEELTLLQEEYADIKYKITTVEDGGTYAELLHRYKQLKTEFEKDAKEWATFMMAKDLLQCTVQSFKKERLPKMLAKAETYLSFLTDGNYIRLMPKQEGSGFLIESKDHILFEANELSQATTEQIYVSIRLALAVTVYEKYKFPIIIDDSFVNFDRKRTKKVTQLLKQLKDYQILFFTCHEHLLTYFDGAEVIHLSKTNLVDSTK